MLKKCIFLSVCCLTLGWPQNCAILYLDPLIAGVIKVDIIRSWRGQQEVIEEREREMVRAVEGR